MSDIKGAYLTFMANKTQNDPEYIKDLLADYEFAKSELAKAGITIYKEQHDAINRLYQDGTNVLIETESTIRKKPKPKDDKGDTSDKSTTVEGDNNLVWSC